MTSKILLVDDERLLRETVKLLLCRQGHTVVEANNGAEALGLFTQARFDLVLTATNIGVMLGASHSCGTRENEEACRWAHIPLYQPTLCLV